MWQCNNTLCQPWQDPNSQSSDLAHSAIAPEEQLWVDVAQLTQNEPKDGPLL